MVVNTEETKELEGLERFKEYLEVRVVQGSLSSETVTTYLAVLWPFWKWLNSRSPSRALDQRYLDMLTLKGKSPSTVATTAHAIKRWHRWQGETVDLEYPSVTVGKPKYLSVEEIEDLLEKCATPLEKVLVYVLFDTAVRISELVNITLDDIDWKQGLLSVVRKGGRRGEVVMQAESMQAIRDWMSVRKSDDERVFMDIDHHAARTLIRKVGQRAGLHVTPHMFRHSRAVQLLMMGVEPHIVQMHLGHLDIRTTLNVYGQFRPEHLREFIPSPLKKPPAQGRKDE